MLGIRLIAALLAVVCDIGHHAGRAVRGGLLNRMSLCHGNACKAESNQDQRNNEPAQHAPAPAFPTCPPVVSNPDHTVLPEAQFHG